MAVLVSKMAVLEASSVPSHLRFNPFITHGYRPGLSVTAAVLSSFSWHNETLNVWTHLLPGCIGLWRAAAASSESPLYVSVVVVLSLTLILSSTYHCLMPATPTEASYRLLLFLDVAGVWLLMFVSTLAVVCNGFVCRSVTVCLAAFIPVALWALISLYRAPTAAARLTGFGTMCVARFVAYGARWCLGRPSADALLLYVVAEVTTFVSGVVYVAREPERCARRKAGHVRKLASIMHVLVAVAMYFLSVAVKVDAEASGAAIWDVVGGEL